MSITGNEIETAIQNERITELERRIDDLWNIVSKQAARIEKLEERTRHVAYMETARIQDIEFVKMLHSAVTTQDKRITELEAALSVTARCLIDGKVNVAGIVPGGLHRHRILGTESVQAMIEVYHRLKK